MECAPRCRARCVYHLGIPMHGQGTTTAEGRTTEGRPSTADDVHRATYGAHATCPFDNPLILGAGPEGHGLCTKGRDKIRVERQMMQEHGSCYTPITCPVLSSAKTKRSLSVARHCTLFTNDGMPLGDDRVLSDGQRTKLARFGGRRRRSEVNGTRWRPRTYRSEVVDSNEHPLARDGWAHVSGAHD